MLKKFTTSTELFHVLDKLMRLSSLSDFRLVGGTALSLLRGHRKSDKEYGSISFMNIEQEIRSGFSHVINNDSDFPELKSIDNNYGLHLFIEDSDAQIKVDILNWNDDFLFPFETIENIRLANIEEIATMKLDAISRGGRKKDFWDLSEILETHSLQSLISIYKEKYPYYNVQLVIKGLTDFIIADDMPDPICFKGKHWEVIQREIRKEVVNL